jgi:hypothetical protein
MIISAYLLTNKDKEPFIPAPMASSFNKCAKMCKEIVNCSGFVLDKNNQCILSGHEITSNDDFTDKDIICNKIQPINNFKSRVAMTRENKLKNAIYKCKSFDRYIQVFSNGDKVTNITGITNYNLNNTLIDYDVKNIGVIQ